MARFRDRLRQGRPLRFGDILDAPRGSLRVSSPQDDFADDPNDDFEAPDGYAKSSDMLSTLKQLVSMIERGEWNIANMSMRSNSTVERNAPLADGRALAVRADDFGSIEIEMRLTVGSKLDPGADDYPDTPSKPNESLSPAGSPPTRQLIFDDDDTERDR